MTFTLGHSVTVWGVAEEAWLLDQVLGKWGEEEVTEDWSEVGEERGDREEGDIQSHVKVWIHGRKQKWEPQSSSLSVFDPAPIPDYDFKTEIERDLLLDDVPN